MTSTSTQSRPARGVIAAAAVACLLVLGIVAPHHHGRAAGQSDDPDAACVLCHFHKDLGTGMVAVSAAVPPMPGPRLVLEESDDRFPPRRFLASASPRAPPVS